MKNSSFNAEITNIELKGKSNLWEENLSSTAEGPYNGSFFSKWVKGTNQGGVLIFNQVAPPYLLTAHSSHCPWSTDHTPTLAQSTKPSPRVGLDGYSEEVSEGLRTKTPWGTPYFSQLANILKAESPILLVS